MKTIKSQVCICGAGISGVFTAYLLGKKGYDVVLIEKMERFNPNGADIIKPPVINIFKELDLYDEIINLGGIERKMVDMFHEGDLLNRFTYEGDDVFLLFPCEKLTKLIAEKLKSLPNVQLFFGEHIEKVEMDHDGTRVSTGNVTFVAEICVACDGDNSILRQEAGLKLQNIEIDQMILFGELNSTAGVEEVSKVYVNCNGGFTYLYPIGGNKSRIVIGFNGEEYRSSIKDADNSVIVEKIRKYLSNEVNELVGTIDSSTQFVPVQPKLFKCEHYYFRRIIFVGNTVHCVHPLSGNGMNLSVEDAYFAVAQIDLFYTQGMKFEACMSDYENQRKKIANNFVDYSYRLFESTFSREQFIQVLNINKYKTTYEET